MIYLDYSATTPVSEEVLESFIETTRNFIGNPNSHHYLGVNGKKLIDAATEQIANILKVKPSEVIYTSGASESNNTAIKGICAHFRNRGRHIITSRLEHSSVIAPISYLQNNGFEVDFVDIDENGQVDLDSLKSLLRDDTILVSIASVNSEVGVSQNINEIAKVVHSNPKTFYHCDITQSLGKEEVDLTNVDLASFSAQKFYGIKGVGGLIKKEKVAIDPLIHGGKSTTVFRSGTPAIGLIVSTAKALRLATEHQKENIEYVNKLSKLLKSELEKIKEVKINSNEYSIPHIVNISVDKIKPETLLHALEEKDIFISTQTACSTSTSSPSLSVLAITKDEERALHSIRISLSHLTTESDIMTFIKELKEIIKKLGDLYESN